MFFSRLWCRIRFMQVMETKLLTGWLAALAKNTGNA